MRTQDLVARLVGDVQPIERNTVARTLNHALIIGLAGNAVLLVALYGIDTEMPEQMLTAMFWIRLAFPLAIVAAALRLAERLAHPGAALGLAWIAAIVPTAMMLRLPLPSCSWHQRNTVCDGRLAQHGPRRLQTAARP